MSATNWAAAMMLVIQPATTHSMVRFVFSPPTFPLNKLGLREIRNGYQKSQINQRFMYFDCGQTSCQYMRGLHNKMQSCYHRKYVWYYRVPGTKQYQ